MKFPKIVTATFFGVLLSGSTLISAEKVGKIKATAAPTNSKISHGQTLEVPFVIDLTKLPEGLGSFTATLKWNPNTLQFQEYTGGTTAGFENPVVNRSEVHGGKLILAHANPYGGNGSVNVLNLKFKVVGQTGFSSPISLSFSAMAAAKSFTDLLPYLDSHTDTEQELEVVAIPESYGLDQNYPNPFNPTTEISYQIPKSGLVHIAVYNVLGQRVRTLVNKKQQAGRYVVQWTGRSDQGQALSSGNYFLRMTAGNFVAERKLLLLR